MENLRVVYLGVPAFAGPGLRHLAENHEILAVVTSKDGSRSNGIPYASAIKLEAEKLNLPVLQPESLSDPAFVKKIRSLDPDLIVVNIFRKIPEDILRIPRYGCLGIHASLLPDFRGLYPVNRAIIEGRSETGVTAFLLSSEIDKGDIVSQTTAEIFPTDTAETLQVRLSELVPQLLDKAFRRIVMKEPATIQGIDTAMTYLNSSTKHEVYINWDDPSEKIDRLVRGLAPRIGAKTILNYKGIDIILRIYEVDIVDLDTEETPYSIDDRLVINIESKAFGVLSKEGREVISVKSLKVGSSSIITIQEAFEDPGILKILSNARIKECIIK